MYGYETWCVKLREEHGVRVFENRVLRGMVWPQREEVTGRWIKTRNEELHDLCSSPDYWGDKMKEDEMGCTCGTYGTEERSSQIFGGEA
jgi:lysylphosphatidylglycerol synthetase-like protein (DUF2156 family)